MDDTTTTAPVEPTPAEPATDPAPEPAQASDEGKGGKDAVLADLAKERDRRQALESQLTEQQNSQKAQLDAIAKALGLKEDDATPDPVAITAELEESRRVAAENAAALIRYKAAVESEVPSHLVKFVTGSTPEEVAASVTEVLAAFGSTKPTGPRPDASQGIQGAPASIDAQIAEAESRGDVKTAIRLKARKSVAPTN